VDEPELPDTTYILFVVRRVQPLDEGLMLSREDLIADALGHVTSAREDLDAAKAELAQAKRQVLAGTGDRPGRQSAWEAAHAQARRAHAALDEANRLYQWARAR
jgi:hypothetical protein